MVLKKLKNIKNALKWLPIVLIHAPIYKSKRNLCWGLWSLGENGLKMLKAPSGYIMVISWLYHGNIMVMSIMVISWLYLGYIHQGYIIECFDLDEVTNSYGLELFYKFVTNNLWIL